MEPTTRTGDAPLRVGISSCLLGAGVRFDGGHKRNAFLADSFGRFVEWVPVCPEVEIGMGTPREPVQLVRRAGGVRLLTTHTGIDYTDAIAEWADRRLDDLAQQDISGYVLKKNSPSCGKESVKVFSENGESSATGRGLFANALLRRFPGLPIEEEDRLHDRQSIETFLDQIATYQRGQISQRRL